MESGLAGCNMHGYSLTGPAESDERKLKKMKGFIDAI